MQDTDTYIHVYIYNYIYIYVTIYTELFTYLFVYLFIYPLIYLFIFYLYKQVYIYIYIYCCNISTDVYLSIGVDFATKQSPCSCLGYQPQYAAWSLYSSSRSITELAMTKQYSEQADTRF